jgi:hypothetical protein
MDLTNVVAEGLGVVSSLLLVMPAIALNKHLREVKEAEDRIVNRTGELTQAIAARAQPTFTDARIPTWSVRDQRLLVAGILAFFLSSGIKLYLAFTAPPVPTPVAVSTVAATAK